MTDDQRFEKISIQHQPSFTMEEGKAKGECKACRRELAFCKEVFEDLPLDCEGAQIRFLLAVVGDLRESISLYDHRATSAEILSERLRGALERAQKDIREEPDDFHCDAIANEIAKTLAGDGGESNG